jgi:hypothetical protein
MHRINISEYNLTIYAAGSSSILQKMTYHIDNFISEEGRIVVTISMREFLVLLTRYGGKQGRTGMDTRSSLSFFKIYGNMFVLQNRQLH